MTIMKRTHRHQLTFVLLVGLSAVQWSRADTTVTAVLTADNHYALLHGSSNGEDLGFVGRNEVGPSGNPGAYNWELPETWIFPLPSGHHLYVVAWNDFSDPSYAMWVGQFSWPGGSLPSHPDAWEVTIGSGANPEDDGEAPTTQEIGADLAAATWVTPADSALNGTSPWGQIPSVGLGELLWHDSITAGAFNDHYLIFRTKLPIEPAVEAPVLEVLHVGTDGLVRLTLSGAPGWYEIQFSDDLSTWHADRSVHNNSGTLEVTTDLSNRGMTKERYFRAARLTYR